MNVYGFHGEGIYEWGGSVFFQTPASPSYPIFTFSISTGDHQFVRDVLHY